MNVDLYSYAVIALPRPEKIALIISGNFQML